ncbi:hypothetical protein HDZ31DRAFT_63408 [Schizophyllum fasciatum]
MTHPYANAAGYILASDALPQDNYRTKEGDPSEGRRPTHRRRFSALSFGFRHSRNLSSTASPSSPSSTAYSSTTAYSASPTTTAYSPKKKGSSSLSDALPTLSFAPTSPPAITLKTDKSTTNHTTINTANGTTTTNTANTTTTTPYVYPDDTWSVLTPTTPSVRRLAFDRQAGVATPEPSRWVAATPEPSRWPESSRWVASPEPSQWMPVTPGPSRMGLTPSPDARRSGKARARKVSRCVGRVASVLTGA